MARGLGLVGNVVLAAGTVGLMGVSAGMVNMVDSASFLSTSRTERDKITATLTAKGKEEDALACLQEEETCTDKVEAKAPETPSPDTLIYSLLDEPNGMRDCRREVLKCLKTQE